MPINKRFAFHKPSPTGIESMDRLRRAFSELEDVIMRFCPDSRERSAGLTQLEVAAMFCNKAVNVMDPEAVAETKE